MRPLTTFFALVLFSPSVAAQRDIAARIAELQDGDPAIRRAAVRAIVERGAAAVPLLVDCVMEEGEPRGSRPRSSGRSASCRAVSPTFADVRLGLEHAAADLRYEAAKALGARGKRRCRHWSSCAGWRRRTAPNGCAARRGTASGGSRGR